MLGHAFLRLSCTILEVMLKVNFLSRLFCSFNNDLTFKINNKFIINHY
jgi:hypothetical protein